MWAGLATFSENSSSSNVSQEENDSSTSRTAKNKFEGYVDGHIVKFMITINKPRFEILSSEEQKRTIAHELGHSFGLLDLTESNWSRNIMYGYSSSYKYVTTNDINGVKFSAHIHKKSDHANLRIIHLML